MAHIRTRETYGNHRLQTELADNGIIIGRDRLARLRKELELRCKQKRKYKATTNSNHSLPVAPNLLNQTFEPTGPSIGSDVCCYTGRMALSRRRQRCLYVRNCRLRHGRAHDERVDGKSPVYGGQEPAASCRANSPLRSRFPAQYCAHDYRAIQEQFGMKTSMSRKGNCYDNAPMESFWGTLKNESLSHYRFNTRNEASSVIREYIEIFYNRQRRHSRLGNTSPAAFRKKYYQMAA